MRKRYLISGYFLTSGFLFCFPQVIHKKKEYSNPILQELSQNKQKTLKIAHRGGPRLTTENTIESFRKTLHVTDCFEMDVCETKDNILVVHHDSSLLRTCGVNKKVNEYDYADLPPFQDEIKLDFAYSQTMITNNEKIPSLEKVFQIFQGVPMNIQLKTPTLTAQKEFARLIREYDRNDITIAGIRNAESNNFANNNPDILTFMSDDTIWKAITAYFIGALPFMTFKDVAFEVPISNPEYLNWKLEVMGSQDHWKVKAAMKFLSFLNFACQPMLWHLKKRGILTFAWVCNSEDVMDKADKLGFQGIMTDEPFILNQFIKSKGKSF